MTTCPNCGEPSIQDGGFFNPGPETAEAAKGLTVGAGGCPVCNTFPEDRQRPVTRRSDDSGLLITVTQTDDPAYRLLQDSYTSTPSVYRRGCYICEDPEFSQMGLPLCRPCPQCSAIAGEPAGHIAADDCVCDVCDYDDQPEPEETG